VGADRRAELYLPLLRCIERRIDRHARDGLVTPGELSPKQLAVTTYQVALDHVLEFAQRPDLFSWLRQLARDVVDSAVRQRLTGRH